MDTGPQLRRCHFRAGKGGMAPSGGSMGLAVSSWSHAPASQGRRVEVGTSGQVEGQLPAAPTTRQDCLPTATWGPPQPLCARGLRSQGGSDWEVAPSAAASTLPWHWTILCHFR